MYLMLTLGHPKGLAKVTRRRSKLPLPTSQATPANGFKPGFDPFDHCAPRRRRKHALAPRTFRRALYKLPSANISVSRAVCLASPRLRNLA